MMKVSSLIETAFRQAALKHSELHRTWIDISGSIGNLLPNSLLPISIQRSGELDMLLRCMEEENVLKRTEPQNGLDFSFHYQMMLSEMWVGIVYEFIRLLIERKLEPQPDQFKEVAHQLRLLRIPIEKYEIAADRKLDAPLEMQKYPPNNDDSDLYTYIKNDPGRAHIMPTGISEQGSAMWHVVDIPNNKTYWIERRSLSEQILAACKK